MYQYNWLFEARSIGEFFKRLGIFILTIIILFLYFIGVAYVIESFIKGFNENYLIITTKLFDNIVCFLLPAIIIAMLYFRIKIKVMTRDIIYKRKNKLYSRIFYFILIFIILFFIYSLNKYTIFYENKVIKHNIIKPLEKEYSYSDIKEGDIGINWRNRKYPSFYYYINFNDGYKVNITNGVFGGGYDLKKLIEVNSILSQKDIIRNIDKTYLDIYKIDFDEDRKNDMYKIFNINN
ncbi:hypothetical protein [Clostridium tertium]|uniref:hypothetical protein n=1 Tax=Clostridium tertium TaxID=1559 RepID=UPI00331C0918